MTWKGFDLAELRAFGVKQTSAGVEIPYLTRKGKHWRSKFFRADGGSHWLGARKAQIPYGLETLSLGGPTALLTEGESDALALRLAFPTLPVLGIPGASSWRNEWTVCLDDFSAVYLSFDADRAGEKLEASVRESIPFARPIRLPGGADTRDVLQQLGKGAYGRLVDEARWNSECTAVWRELERAVSRRRSVDEAWERRAAA